LIRRLTCTSFFGFILVFVLATVFLLAGCITCASVCFRDICQESALLDYDTYGANANFSAAQSKW
jgi:hypothetical protein